MPLTTANLLASEYLLAQQDNKDNFLYENVRTAPWALNPYRARFKDILFSSTGLWNAPYSPIGGSPFGGLNSVAPYTASNDTWIIALDSTEKGLLLHTSIGGLNPFLWDSSDVANFTAAPPNTLFPSATSFANRLGDATSPPGWLGNPYYLMAEDTFTNPFNFGRISRGAFSSVKVTLVWTGTPSTTDTDANLDLFLWTPWTGFITTANAGWFGGSSTVGVDSVTGPSERILGAGAVEYYEQIYIPWTGFGWWNNNVLAGVTGTLGSVPAATGQDFSIFFTSRPSVGQGHGWGDVHMSTFDGKVYDLQSIGKVIYAKSLTDDFQVQTHQKAWYTGAQVSVNTAFAVRVNNQTYVYDSELAIGQELKVNGVTHGLSSGGSAVFGNTRIQRSGNQYIITSAGQDGNFATAEDNDVVTASDNGSYVDVFIKPSDLRAGSLQGLLGNGDGDTSNDFAKRDGTSLGANLTVNQIHSIFVDEWRVRAGESLFGDGDIAAKATSSTAVIVPVPEPEPVPIFPKEFISLETLARQNPQAVADAFDKARQFVIPEGTFLTGAVHDFLVTGDEAFLKGAQQAADLARRNPLETGLDPGVVVTAQATSVLAPLGSIEGSKWEDLNANGIWETGEKGLAGWTIYIDSVNNETLDPWELSTVTDANGKYSFANLGPGNYAIREVNQVGWVQTSPSAPYALTLNVGDSWTDINFGNYQLPVLTLNPKSQILVEGLTNPQNAAYTVTLSKASSQTISVNYATTNGSATAGLDYTASNGTLTFNPGVTSQTITIPILNNSINEADESFSLTLSSPTSNAVLGAQSAATTVVTDTLVASVTTTLSANVENLTLTGTSAINGTGNAGNNVITGNGGNNVLNGGSGNDNLNGGAGRDTLTGGLGTDVFLFQFTQSTATSPDRISDFAIGTDKIDLLAASGGVLPAPGSFSRAADSAAATLNDVLTAVFNDANGSLAGNQTLGTNSAALVRVTTAAIAGTYLVVNDDVAGFQTANDLVVNMTGFTGTVPALGNILVSSFFV
jgi:hypothetical protein